jgi:hypothetical protein
MGIINHGRSGGEAMDRTMNTRSSNHSKFFSCNLGLWLALLSLLLCTCNTSSQGLHTFAGGWVGQMLRAGVAVIMWNDNEVRQRWRAQDPCGCSSLVARTRRVSRIWPTVNMVLGDWCE